MPVWTKKEYGEIKSKKIEITESSGRACHDLLHALPDKKEESKKVYIFGFAEIIEGIEKNFVSSFVLNGESIKFECKKNIVRTENEVVAKYLKESGYVLLEEKEIKNAQNI